MRWSRLEFIAQDVRYAVRIMRRAPAFTAAGIVSLALGIGANTAIFSLLDGLALRSLPLVDNPDELVRLVEATPDNGAPRETFSYPSYEQLRRGSRLLSAVLLSSGPSGAPVDRQGERHIAHVEIVSDNYFDALGAAAARGRLFRESSSEPSGEIVAVISWSYWRQYFAADPAALGARIRVRNRDLTIVGITPEGFIGTDIDVATDVWVPFEQFVPLTDAASRTSQRWLRVMGRLQPDATRGTAEAEVAALLTPTVRLQPGDNGYSALRRRLTDPLLFIELVVALVLLITFANLANLSLAGSSARARELAVRRAVGASRRRLVGQLFTESLVLAVAGAAVALVVASWMNNALLRFIPPEQAGAAARLAFTLDARVVGVAISLALLASLTFGLAPALAATRFIQTDLRVGAGSTPVSRSWMNRGLIAGQVAACTLLLVVAGVFLRSVQNLRGQDTGFREEQLLVADVEPPREMPEERRDVLLDELRARAAALPGVQVAAFSQVGQLSGGAFRVTIGFPNRPPTGRDPEMVIAARTTPGFFAAMGTPPITGRDFADRDGAMAPTVAIVNESFVRQFFPGRDPVGQRFFQEGGSRARELMEIVGVVRDTKWVNLRDDPPAIFYQPYAQRGGTPVVRFAIRASGDLETLAATFVQTARAVNRQVLVRNVVPFRTIVDRTLITERLVAQMSAAFGAIALVVAGVGVYGVLTFAVVRRRREIGVRIAVGASPRAVAWMIVRESLVLLWAGFLVGIPAAIAVIRVVSAWLFGLTPGDPWTLSATLVVLTVSTIAAAYLPARRAAAIDPIVVLKSD